MATAVDLVTVGLAAELERAPKDHELLQSLLAVARCARDPLLGGRVASETHARLAAMLRVGAG